MIASRLLLLASTLVLLASAAAAAPPAAPADDPPALRCTHKPQAPIEVDARVDDLPGGDVALQLEVRPRRALTDLSWELVTGGPARRVGGDPEGALPDQGGLRRALLAVPRDGRFAEVELLVSATLPDSGERVTVPRRFTWGTPVTPVRAVASLDARDGSPRTVAAVPSAAAGAPARTPAAAEGSGSFVVTGTFLYEDKAWGFNGWTGEDPLLPVRHADVTVIDAGAAQVLGTGITDADGAFAIACSADGPLDLVIRCDAASFTDPAFQDMHVEAPEGWTYALFAEPVLDHDPAFDVHVGVNTALAFSVGSKEGNPFNVFDMSVAAFEFLFAPPFAAEPDPERVITHDWPGGPQSQAFIDATDIADDDGFDDAVILHEAGHVVQSLWSEFGSGGGVHFFGDSDQNPRLSMSEGFATFFAGAVQLAQGRTALYVDSNGSLQLAGAQLRARLETAAPYTNDARGVADEVAVACALLDIIDDAGSPDAQPGADDDPFDGSLLVEGDTPAAAFWRAFTAPVDDSLATSLNNVWDNWIAVHPVEPQAAALAATFQGFGQDFTEDAAEPDDTPAEATLLPTLPLGGWTAPRTLYRTTGGALAPGDGDVDWFAHELVIGSVMKFLTRYPNAAPDADTQADTTVELFDPSGQSVAFDLDSGPGRNGRVTDFTITETGTWTVRVARQDPQLRRYGRYEYRGQVLFENLVPQLTGAPTAQPGVIADDQTALLSAPAVDGNPGQALSWQWMPLGGGSVSGSGAQVEFLPPTVDANTEFAVQVVVRDELGAESAPAVVTLVVTPSAVGPCDASASVAVVGAGKPGALGVPQLVAEGAPTVPATDLVLRVSGAQPGASGTLVAGLARADLPFDQGTLHPRPDLLLGVTADAAGSLELAAPLTEAAALCGFVVTVQAFFSGDPGASGALQTAQSNALDLTLGH